MEIERKFTINKLPENLESYDHHVISQAYLNRTPVVRIRRSDDEYYMTYKGKGMMAREEYNLPLTAEAYSHLLEKADGRIINKVRYLIPIISPAFENGYVLPEGQNLTVELDIFEGDLAPLIMAEVEFPDEKAAVSYIPEAWFEEDVTGDPRYHNVNMVYGEIY